MNALSPDKHQQPVRSSFIRSLTRFLAIGICLVLFLFGLARIGVGGALIAQQAGMIQIEELTSALNDTRDFLDTRHDQQLISLTPTSYLAVIVFMGICLSLGALGTWRHKNWGLALIAVYLLTHAGLFLNFQTINRKVVYLIVGVILFLFLLWHSRQPRGHSGTVESTSA